MTRALKSPGLWVVLVVVAALAALHLPYPFAEDQATFTWGAQAISEGARYYRDFWDMKQPGIYWWYVLSGNLFGFDTFGIRWMDMLWAVVVAPVLWAALRQRSELAGVLAACLAFGTFYAKAGAFHLSQLEWLIGGPIAVIFLVLSASERPTHDGGRIDWRYAWVGVMTTVIATFKLMEALIPFAMFVTALAHSHWAQGQPWGRLLREKAVPVVAGALGSALVVMACLFVNGTLGATLWTAFVYPAEAIREYEHSPWFKLLWAFHWFRRGNIWLAPWALWAVFVGIRHARRLELLCVAWGASALVIVSMQVLSFWEYHFDLLFMPLGLLAALGFCDVLDRLGKSSRPELMRGLAVAAMAICVIACMGRPLAEKVQRLARAVPFTPERLAVFQGEVATSMPMLRRTAAQLDRLSSPQDRILIWGDQRLYSLSNRRPVLQLNGNTRFLRQQLSVGVDYVRLNPPLVIYLATGREHLTMHDGGGLPRLVEEQYVKCGSDDVGSWYRPRGRGC
ncbi:MAG: hypothetical protein JSS14_09695 [Proteobacteria bacterium]|nr:hypothetical protein [Pseudomonadota bacterium]